MLWKGLVRWISDGRSPAGICVGSEFVILKKLIGSQHNIGRDWKSWCACCYPSCQPLVNVISRNKNASYVFLTTNKVPEFRQRQTSHSCRKGSRTKVHNEVLGLRESFYELLKECYAFLLWSKAPAPPSIRVPNPNNLSSSWTTNIIHCIVER